MFIAEKDQRYFSNKNKKENENESYFIHARNKEN